MTGARTRNHLYVALAQARRRSPSLAAALDRSYGRYSGVVRPAPGQMPGAQEPPQLRATYLPKLFRADLVCCQLSSKPGAGLSTARRSGRRGTHYSNGELVLPHRRSRCELISRGAGRGSAPVATDVLAQSLRLRVVAGGRGDARPQQTYDHEVKGAQIRQRYRRTSFPVPSAPNRVRSRSSVTYRDSHWRASSVLAHKPTFASPPLSPDRAPQTLPRGTILILSSGQLGSINELCSGSGSCQATPSV